MKAIGTKLALQAALVLIFLGSVMLVCAFQNSTAAAQTRKPAPKPASTAPAHFSAAGLNNEDDLLRIYSGDFQSVRIDHGSSEFGLIISSYMESYATDCKQFLPPNKVEITRSVCTQTATPVNGNGQVVGLGHCTTHQTVGTGLYADPKLYAAEQAAEGNMSRDMFGMGTRGAATNPFTMPNQMLDQVTAGGTEMDTLIHTNGCNSPGLRSFQTNLIRFANGEAPIKFAGAVASAPARPGDPEKDTDFGRLLNDLVAANARGWLMNRYQPGSIVDAYVSPDPLGHPVRVYARYSYSDTQGAQRGRVTLSFKDGVPDCLYFSDDPDTCRLPAASVVSAYEKNAYAK